MRTITAVAAGLLTLGTAAGAGESDTSATTKTLSP